jgi:anaerobic magnesium-protoporphyrin IX monomethyl ester cyclase
MKVLLVSPPFYKPYTKGQTMADAIPLGLGYVASYSLSKTNAEIKIIDYGIETYSDDIWKQTLSDYKPDVIGFSALTLGYQQVNKMATIARGTNALLVSGGAHSTIIPEDLLETCDVAIRGEGEVTFYEIISGKKFEDIDGIAYKHKGRVWKNNDRKRIENLDELPMPAYQLFKHYNLYSVTSSRGCPFACSFCSNLVLWNRVMRLRSSANVVNEIEILNKRYGIKHLIFQDDTFNLTVKRGLDICNEIIERKIDMQFTMAMRANKECVSIELFERMKEAGCIKLEFGVESGSNKILKSLNKNLTVKEASNAIRMAHKVGIKSVRGFFMVGNWDETPFDIVKTWWFIARNPVDPILTVSTPLPATALYKKSKELGYLDEVNWANVNWVTPIARTNKMSKRTILWMYYLTVLFVHLPARTFRGNSKDLIKGIWNYALRKLRIIK